MKFILHRYIPFDLQNLWMNTYCLVWKTFFCWKAHEDFKTLEASGLPVLKDGETDKI